MSGERNILHPAHLQAGKAASKSLVRAAGGGEAAEPYCGKSQPRLSAYGLPNTGDFMPIDTVVALEAVTHGHAGHPQVTRWMAGEAGYLLVPKPKPLGGGLWGRMTATLAKEAGDVTSGLCADLADDNDISPGEARARLKDAGELVRIAIELEAALQARAGDA